MKSIGVIISIGVAWVFIVIGFQALQLRGCPFNTPTAPRTGQQGSPEKAIRKGMSSCLSHSWTILSILIMGLNATLFAFNMWVA